MDSSIIDIDAIIAIVAKKHKVLLSEDDPVLVSATLNEYVVSEVMEHYCSELSEQLEALYARNASEQKEMAKRIINASLSAAKDAISKSSNDSAEALTKAIQTERKALVADMQKATKQVNKAKNVVIVFGSVAVGLTAIFAAFAVSL